MAKVTSYKPPPPREPNPTEVRFRDDATPPGGWNVWLDPMSDGVFRWTAFSGGVGREGSVSATLKPPEEVRDMAAERARKEYENLAE